MEELKCPRCGRKIGRHRVRVDRIFQTIAGKGPFEGMVLTEGKDSTFMHGECAEQMMRPVRTD